MADSLKEVIAKLKAQQENSQQHKPVEAVKPVKQDPIPQYDDNDDNDDREEVDETPVATQKLPRNPKQEEVTTNAQKLMLLQDNGIFRAELLHEMNELKETLVVIAGALVELSANGKRTK